MGLATLLEEVGREDLGRRLRIAAARILRPTTVVCVVGEFKQGKSSLINALLQRDVCPVDDDIATSAITLIHHAEETSIHVRRRQGGSEIVENVEPDRLGEFVTEAGNPRNVKQVERVDVGLADPVLATGLTLVDTPGMGGLGAGQSAHILAFLPYADGLVFTSDASSELTVTERDFLVQAAELCPVVLFALTKTDIAPEWRRIFDIDREHLAATGLIREILPVSSVVQRAAGRAGLPELAAQSGFDRLHAAVAERVIRPAKRLARERAGAEARVALAHVESALDTERALLNDEQALDAALASLTDARARLEHLRGPGARWSVLLGDRTSDLTADTNFRLRADLRSLSRRMDDSIESLKTPDEWEQLGRQLQTEVAGSVARVFAELEERIATTRVEIAELLLAEDIATTAPGSRLPTIDIEALWSNVSLADGGRAVSRAVGQSVTALRGAQSGVLLLGMVGQFVPAGAAALLFATPVTLGLGVAFAGGQLLEANRRKIAMRRQKARAAVRQFLDDVQFEVSNRLSDQVKLMQRALRDEFTDRMVELQRTFSDAIQRAQQGAEQDRAQRDARTRAIVVTLERLRSLREQIEGPGVRT